MNQKYNYEINKPKLVPKHKDGSSVKSIEEFFNDFGNTGLGKLIMGFGNAQISGDSGIGTSMATASGYNYNTKSKQWEHSSESAESSEVSLLRDNLAILSASSPTHPVTALVENVILPGIAYVGAKYIKPLVNLTRLTKKTKTLVNQFKDKYGREITPTPYNGPDSDLIQIIDDALINVLKDYWSPEKIQQLKTTMNWGDSEIAEFHDELIRALGTKSQVLVKGPKDGFTNIGEHHGLVVGTGNNAEAKHVVTLNRERIPNSQMAEEAGIHELGVHGKTVSMQAEDFGKGGFSDKMKEMFPRLAELTLKNKELADGILHLNRRGKFLDLFKTIKDLELYFDRKGLSWDKFEKFNNQRKYYLYVNKADEKTARAYTGLLYEKLHGPEHKTQNIELLERYFTPESVEKFKKAVLVTAPIVGVNAVINE